ncbi:MAG TPA: DUF5683 domain-containing protein [Ignavibacteriales bacterium]|nr:DUF5683 domain-containing protein [Ignavibacteriales bacterium]HOL80209.1 DUF5683 domain-containing protein [Ignavibacteriales bacterium]HOM64490.1 DUF5683 domain-containing protein [Ignavibacteriales bacterium]HPD66587.1 DUF5683 domain-containing protein [Ignavibacteriales bacterium]HPP32398.1 DUF5683 domain-containing protein [Ignavibacteriales bacterium]
MKKHILIILIIVFNVYSKTQYNENYYIFNDVNENILLTGNLNIDSKNLQNNTATKGNKKKALASAGLSLLLPGAGQVYNKEYLKAAIFLGIEIGLIYTNIHYNKKGDDQTKFYQNYAHQHWDPLKYARYSIKNAKVINPDIKDEDIPKEDELIVNGKLNWQRMNEFELKLNKWYSHQLPPFGTQQYYELIGKYTQFISGWDDCDAVNFTYESLKTKNSEYYMNERAKANDFYNYATKAGVGILINHILSAIEAGYSRFLEEKNMSLNVNVKPNYYIKDMFPYFTTIDFQYRF